LQGGSNLLRFASFASVPEGNVVAIRRRIRTATAKANNTITTNATLALPIISKPRSDCLGPSHPISLDSAKANTQEHDHGHPWRLLDLARIEVVLPRQDDCKREKAIRAKVLI